LEQHRRLNRKHRPRRKQQPYFRDQWSDWYNGTTFALPFTPSAVAAQTAHTLRLLP
jgi:hypothetical protein